MVENICSKFDTIRVHHMLSIVLTIQYIFSYVRQSILKPVQALHFILKNERVSTEIKLY